MKKFFRFLFHSTYTLAFLLAGCFLLALYFEYPYSEDFLTSQIDLFLSDRLYILIAGVSLVTIALLYLMINIIRKRKESFLSYNSPEGEILISLFAVEDFIKKITRSFREIKDSYPTINLKGKDGVEVKIKLKIWSGIASLPVAIEEIQKEIRNQLQNMLGIENIHGVHVFLAKDSFAQRDIPMRKRRSVSDLNKIKPAPVVPKDDGEFISEEPSDKTDSF